MERWTDEQRSNAEFEEALREQGETVINIAAWERIYFQGESLLRVTIKSGREYLVWFGDADPEGFVKDCYQFGTTYELLNGNKVFLRASGIQAVEVIYPRDPQCRGLS